MSKLYKLTRADGTVKKYPGNYEKNQATLRLMNELAKGRSSGEEEGWLTANEMREHFRVRVNEE